MLQVKFPRSIIIDRLADAGFEAFVDPLFSSGVHVAMTGALSAASTILGSMKGQVTEVEAQAWHDAKIGICQTRSFSVL